MARHQDLLLQVRAGGEGERKEADIVPSKPAEECGEAPEQGQARPRMPVWWKMIVEREAGLDFEPGAEPYRLLLRVLP